MPCLPLRRHLTVALCAALVGGCSSGLQVYRLSPAPIDTTQRAFVLLTPTPWDLELRQQLALEHFTVKKFASVEDRRARRTTDSAGVRVSDERAYHEAAARYGLTLVEKSRQDYCPWNQNINATFALEVSDLETNDVVLVLQRGNWTGLCGPFSVRKKYVFQELADALREQWR